MINWQVATKLLIRTSERSSFKTCRQAWRWGWVEELRSPDRSKATTFGDLVHRALAEYYVPGARRGTPPARTFERLYHEDMSITEEADFYWPLSDDDLEMGVRLLERYVQRWGAADSEWEVLSSEQTFQVKIAGRVQLGMLRSNVREVWYVGTIDGVWRHLPTRRITFAEHKTVSRFSEAAYAMDDQAGAYWCYGPKWLRAQGILAPDEDLSGILYNKIRKEMPPAANAKVNERGEFLTTPRKATLLEHYRSNARPLPSRRDGRSGHPRIEDMEADLGQETFWRLGEVSSKQPSALFDRATVWRTADDRRTYHQRVLREVRDMIRARSDLDEFVYKNPGPQFMPNCQFCQFRDMCELHETGNDWETFRDATFGKWEPYAAHNLPERR